MRTTQTNFDFIDTVTNNTTETETLQATGIPLVAANTRHPYAIVSYDAYKNYKQAADDVARQIRDITRGERDVLRNNCDPYRVHGYIIVAHSMGGVVVSFINGNSRPGASYYQQSLFAAAMQRINFIITVQSPLQGTEMSDIICESRENFNIFDDILHTFVFECDPGTRSLQTLDDFRLENNIEPGALPVTTYMAGGHVGLVAGRISTNSYTAGERVRPVTAGISTNTHLYGSHTYSRDVLENDGVVEIRSQWACKSETFVDYNNNPDKGRHHFGPCERDETIRPGFIPFSMSTETHDQGRNASSRRAIQNPCTFLSDIEPARMEGLRWGTQGCMDNSFIDNLRDTKAIELNIAQTIRCVFGNGHADEQWGHLCPKHSGVEPADLTRNLNSFVLLRSADGL